MGDLCDVCGRDMRAKKGTIIVSGEDFLTVYPEIELGRSYRVCWVCWMKSLGLLKESFLARLKRLFLKP
jgi:hypothetical protein